jgi:chitinase
MGATRTFAVVCVLVSSLAVACGSAAPGAAADPSTASASSPAPVAVGIYDDRVLPGWIDWSWGTTRDFAATGRVHAGTRSIAVTYQAWGGLYFRRTTAALSGADALQLYVNGGKRAGNHLWVVGVLGNAEQGTVELGSYCQGGTIPANAWTLCRIPLSDLGPAGTAFDGFWVQESQGQSLPKMFFDDVALTGGAAPPPVVPDAPAGLAAAASSAAVSLSWNAVAGATGYDVYRAAAAAGPFTRLTGAPQAATSYADAAVTAGSTYWYQVTAVNAAGASRASATVSATVPAPKPVTVSVTPASSTLAGCTAARFTAAVTGAADGSVTWSVQEGAAGGTIDASGNYTAPSAAGTYHVVATSNAAPTTRSTVPVVVQDRILSVAVVPASASLTASGTVRLAATVTTTCGTFAAQ